MDQLDPLNTQMAAQQAEAARQAIRDKHAVTQTDIDAAETGDDLIQIIKSL